MPPELAAVIGMLLGVIVSSLFCWLVLPRFTRPASPGLERSITKALRQEREP